MLSANTAGQDRAKENMDRMYRWTRHVYDASRKYYLLGRDVLIEKLKPAPGETVCEVGCGTARNLIKMAQTYPRVTFLGIDVSDEMLKTAQKSIEKAEVNINLAQGYAQNFDPQKLFNLEKRLDKIVFSYALSIIPPWKESIDHALKLLPSDGEMHIVDFGGQEDLPAWFQKFLFVWLSLFHVFHKPEILEYLQELEKNGHGKLTIETLYKGYAYRAVFRKS